MTWTVAAAAVITVVGHIFPVWLGFRAGKGVATGLGVFLAVAVAWVFFRADNVASAVAILKGMAGLNGFVLPAQVVELVPALQGFVTVAATVPLLGNGTVTGIFEILGLLLLSFVICWGFPPTQRKRCGRRLSK